MLMCFIYHFSTFSQKIKIHGLFLFLSPQLPVVFLAFLAENQSVLFPTFPTFSSDLVEDSIIPREKISLFSTLVLLFCNCVA